MNSLIRALIALLISGLPVIASAGQVCTPAVKQFCATKGHDAAACLKPLSGAIESMTTQWIKAWIDEHNRVRASVVEAKPPLPKVLWSDELADVASRWASRCEMVHSQCRVTPRFQSVGENMFWFASSDSQLTPAFASTTVNAWESERKVCSQGAKPYEFESDCGRYTQLVWRKTTTIGCGVARCSDGDQSLKGKFMAVCMYAPAGNWMGEKTY